MSADIKQHVDTNSAEFKQGVADGLNSVDDTKNWEAGNELGQELKDEGEIKKPVYETPADEFATPLFLKDSPDVDKGNAQDEKDETEE